MSGITLIRANAPRAVGCAPGTQAGSVAATTALPPAGLPEGDALTSLYAILAKDRDLNMKQAASNLKFGQKQRRDAIAKQKAAVEKATRARKKGGFWKKLAKKCSRVARAATVVAAVAVAVGTAGAATPVAALAIAGASLSAASFVQGETKVLQHFGMSDSLAAKFEMGMTIGSIACSAGALGAQSLAAEGANTAAESVKTVARVSSAVAGASEAVGGVATIEAGRHDAEAEDALADALEAQLENKAVARQIDAIIEAVEESEASDERVLGSLRKSIETRDLTLVSASGRA